jgi:hypothetical protein
LFTKADPDHQYLTDFDENALFAPPVCVLLTWSDHDCELLNELEAYLVIRIGYPDKCLKKVRELLIYRLNFFRNHFAKSKS